MRCSIILAVLAVSLFSFGCGSEESETIPDALIGLWKTSAPGYQDKALELRKDAILFGVGRSQFNANSVFKVTTVPQAQGRTFLITIYYTDKDGYDVVSPLYYDPTPPGSIRFKNQSRIEWKLVERRPAGKASVVRRRAAAPWWRQYGFNIALALLGMALTTGATLWRFQESKAGKRAAGVAQPESGSPRRVEGDLWPKDMEGAEATIDWAQAPTAVPAIAVKEQRRSERILLKLPVGVAGIDAEGKPFEERAFTLSINRHGAFIILRNLPREGEQINVTNLGTRHSCPFRLCESGKDSTGEVTAWGIECLEPNSSFWQIRFPEKFPEPLPRKIITALVRCSACRVREVAELSHAEYRTLIERGSIKRDCSDCGVATEWEFILLEPTPAGSPEETAAISLPAGEDHRREKRIVAKLPIRLRHPQDGRTESTLTENVSKSGVCCAANMELMVDDVILLTFESGAAPGEDESPARIVWYRSMGQNRKTLYGIRLERGIM